MSDTHKYGDIPLDTRENKVRPNPKREEEGFAELKGHLANFKRRMLEASSLEELLESDLESVD